MAALLFQASLASVLLVVVLLKQWSAAHRRKSLLPPGPPGLPLVGNTFQWPSMSQLQPTLSQWARKYGADFSHRFIQ